MTGFHLKYPGAIACKLSWLGLFCFLVASCASTKALRPGEQLYKGAEFTIQLPDSVETKPKEIKGLVQSLVNQKPNRQILGIPFKLKFFSLFTTKAYKESGKENFFQRLLGVPPVVFKPAALEQTTQYMENQLFNNGYFAPSCTTFIDTLDQKGKKVKVNYQVKVPKQHQFGTIENRVEDSTIREIIQQLPPNPDLQVGKPYSLKVLKKEREAISEALQDKGFYMFDDDYLHFKVDTLRQEGEVQLRMSIKEGVKPNEIDRYRIGKIYIHPDFNPTLNRPLDTIPFRGVIIVQGVENVKPNVLEEATLFNPGDYYSTERHENTLSRLLNIPYFQFVNIRYDRSETDTTQLNMKIYLKARERQTISASVGGYWKPSLYWGPEISLDHKHRNLFRRASQGNLNLTANFNFPLENAPRDYFEELELDYDYITSGLWIPFVEKRKRAQLRRADTKLSLELTQERFRVPLDSLIAPILFLRLDELLEELQDDPGYAPFARLTGLTLSFGYIWQRQQTILNEFNPLRFEYQLLNYENNQLKNLLQWVAFRESEEPDGNLFANFEPSISYNPEYIFTFDSRLEEEKTHNWFYRGRAGLALTATLPQDFGLLLQESSRTIIGEIENDLRYFFKPKAPTSLAARLRVNNAYPFEDKLLRAIVDYYTIGGPNSIRAFVPRTLGPGTQDPAEAGTNLLAGQGDFLIEGSLELRQRFGKKIELAGFLDAGNVWLNRTATPDDPALFDWSDFYKELGVGTGIGLRYDFGYLILRFDFAFPLTKPWLPEGERWVGDEIDLGDPNWRKENLNFIFAFGYPF